LRLCFLGCEGVLSKKVFVGGEPSVFSTNFSVTKSGSSGFLSPGPYCKGTGHDMYPLSDGFDFFMQGRNQV